MILKSCCLCISVRKGTLAIGIFNLVAAISSIATLDIFGFILRVFTALTFTVMVYKDSSAHRLYFFVCYLTNELIIYVLEVVVFI